MTIILVIIGLILLLAGSGWFSGAATVGIILLVIGVVGLIIQMIFVGVASTRINSMHKEFNSSRSGPFRNDDLWP